MNFILLCSWLLTLMNKHIVLFISTLSAVFCFC